MRELVTRRSVAGRPIRRALEPPALESLQPADATSTWHTSEGLDAVTCAGVTATLLRTAFAR